MLTIIGIISGFLAGFAWGRWYWHRRMSSAMQIARCDVSFWRSECQRVQAVLHSVPSDIVVKHSALKQI